MSHLNLETLARLIDDAPDPTEAGHLDICAQCREELEAMRADVAALAALPDPEPSPAQWQRLEARLKREGLMRYSGWHWQPALLRAAAAIVLFLLGGATSLLIMRPNTPPPVVINRPESAQPVLEQHASAQEMTPAFEAPARSEPAVTLAQQPAQPVATAVPQAPRTAQEAAAQLRSAELAYLAALTRYAELSGGMNEGDPVARLAALESIVATTRAALGSAPADPVINGYHLTAVAQRDALLRQVNANGETWY